MAVVEAVRAAAHDVARALPRGVSLTPVYDQATLVEASVASVRDAIALGVLLCFVVLGLSLRNLRAGVVAATVVPAVLAATFLVMRALGQSLNIMSLGGMAVAVGLVIDDAIIVVEAIARHLEEGLTPPEASRRGADELAAAVIGTTATTVVVFVPLAFVEGVVGSFFGALATTLSAAVILSLVVSLTAVPAVAARVFKARAVTSGPSWLDALYARLAAWGAKRRWVGVAMLEHRHVNQFNSAFLVAHEISGAPVAEVIELGFGHSTFRLAAATGTTSVDGKRIELFDIEALAAI